MLKKINPKIIAYILYSIFTLQIGLSGYALYLIYVLNILSTLYFIIGFIVLLLLSVIAGTLMSRKKTAVKIFGVIISIISIGASSFAIAYTNRTLQFLDTVTGVKTEKITYDVYVLKTSEIENIQELEKIETCIVKNGDKGIDEAISSLNKSASITLKQREVSKYDELLVQLYNGSCKAIVFNNGFNKIAEEQYSTFASDVRKLKTVEVTVGIEQADNKDVKNENINFYLSGNDSYGSILSNGRSDVNMLITINQKNQKILITNVPRDYYVPLSCANGVSDKLTHAGVYGIDCSMHTIEQLFNTKINYYLKVNFTSFVKVVDAVGGVDVNVKQGFSTGTHTFSTGINHMNSAQALAFSRDRYHQEGGDRGRGENQQLVIGAIAKKLFSPSIAQNFFSVLDSFGDSFATNLSREQMSTLLQQFVTRGEYPIQNQSVDGTGGMSTTYTYSSQQLSVIFPNSASVEKAKAKIAEYSS